MYDIAFLLKEQLYIQLRWRIRNAHSNNGRQVGSYLFSYLIAAVAPLVVVDVAEIASDVGGFAVAAMILQ